MNNLVFFNEAIKQKMDGKKLNNAKQKAKNRYKYRLQERINKSKSIIQKEFNKYSNEEVKEPEHFEVSGKVIDLESPNSKKINIISNDKKYKININNTLKKLFMLNSKTSLINFLNSIYNDCLSLQTKIDYIINQEDKNNETMEYPNLEIIAKDKNRKFKYEVQFETENNDQIAINILRCNFETNSGQSIKNGQNMKRDYETNEYHNVYDYKSKMQLPKAYMILIDSNVDVPDVCAKSFKLNNKDILCEFNIVKGWKYDLKKLYENNMYLLLPLKIFDLRKRLFSIKYQIDILPKTNDKLSQQELKLQNLIKDDIIKFFKSFNRYLQKMKQKGLISNTDIDELNLISLNLLGSFDDGLEDIVLDIEEEIRYKLKEFYL